MKTRPDPSPAAHCRATDQRLPEGHRPAADNRQGLVLVVCLVCLLLLGMTTGVLIRAVLLHRDRTRTMLPQVQAEWIAHAATQQAAATLRSDPAWHGADWTVSPEDIGLPEDASRGDPAAIRVRVTSDAAAATRKTVAIRVDYPPNATRRVRTENVVTVELPDR